MQIVKFEQGGVRLFQLHIRELAEPEIFREHYDQMSDTRRLKVDRQRTDAGKRLSLGAGILLDEGLKEYGLREREIEIATKENGKPVLKDYPEIYFNLSHSKEMALAAFAHSEVGCDIEYGGALKLQIARRFFCPEEYEYLISQPQERQREVFYRLWTLKESFMKVTGLGMRLMPNQFSFRFGQVSGEACFPYMQEVMIRQDVDDAKYRFKEYFSGGYHMAVCVKA